MLPAEAAARGALGISATSLVGVPALVAALDARAVAARDARCVRASLYAADGEAQAWLYAHGVVVAADAGPGGATVLTVRIDAAARARFAARFPAVPLLGA